MSQRITANENQRHNPLVKHLRIAVDYDKNLKADFVPAASCCGLYLSLEYHKLHPDYIYDRMSKVGREFPLRVVFVVVDVDNHTDSVHDLIRACLVNDFTLVLCWSPREVALYLEELKKNEKTRGELVKGQKPKNYGEQLQHVLTRLRGVNSTDTLNLAGEFGSFRDILRNSQREKLESIRGLGARKAQVISQVFNEPLGGTDMFVSSQAGSATTASAKTATPVTDPSSIPTDAATDVATGATSPNDDDLFVAS